MKMQEQDNLSVLEHAGEDIAALLCDIKKRKKRIRIYRCSLYVVLVISILTLAGMGYYSLYGSIPSIIRVRAGSEESLNLGLPAQGVISVSDQGKSNIPEGAVTLDLSEPISLNTSNIDSYNLQVNLFGFLPFKQVGIQIIEDQELVPVGVPIGIYVKSDGILVIGVGDFVGLDGVTYSPAKYILKSGDYILKLDGIEVTKKDDFINRIEQCGGKEVIVTIRRDDTIMDFKIKPACNQSGKYKIGIWVRDNAQGVGTMTFIDGDGNFGALGHGINDIDTSTLMEMEDGTLYQTEIISIKKGENGAPGEMTGLIVYAQDRILGDIHHNSTQGIFGVCNEKALKLATKTPIPIGLKQEITEGKAQVLCTVDGTPQYYDIEITAIHLDHDNVNRGIEIRVTDSKLLSITGGIIQGMSGAPIIQDGKFVGAVTHVLVQDSTRGYGIFIENMLIH